MISEKVTKLHSYTYSFYQLVQFLFFLRWKAEIFEEE